MIVFIGYETQKINFQVFEGTKTPNFVKTLDDYRTKTYQMTCFDKI